MVNRLAMQTRESSVGASFRYEKESRGGRERKAGDGGVAGLGKYLPRIIEQSNPK